MSTPDVIEEIRVKTELIQRLKSILQSGKYIITEDLILEMPPEHKQKISDYIVKLKKEVKELATKVTD